MVSCDNYRRYMASKILIMFGVYMHVERSYTTTGGTLLPGIYDSYRGNVETKRAMTPLTNYNRPIYYVMAYEDDGSTSATPSKYMRVLGSTAVTLVALDTK
ncbi:hypothetical protein BGW41_007426, partial [Actinomortierella wolfii]